MKAAIRIWHLASEGECSFRGKLGFGAHLKSDGWYNERHQCDMTSITQDYSLLMCWLPMYLRRKVRLVSSAKAVASSV